jgi:hypothetical protein
VRTHLLQTAGDLDRKFPEEPLLNRNVTRTLLPRIGWSAEEALRTSEEKSSLAQAIYDSVCGSYPIGIPEKYASFPV